MVKKLYTKCVKWQAQTKKKGLANLLINQKITKILLRFLQMTEIGSREKMKKKKLE